MKKKLPIAQIFGTPTKVTNEVPKEIVSEGNFMVQNGLSQAILGFDPNAPAFATTQLSQVDTLFKNNRWYLISNMRQLLNEIYVEHGIIQTIVDVPVDDGMRGGVTIKSKQLDPDEIEQLITVMDRENDMGTAGQGVKWTRLFGGGGILILTDQDPSTPLKLSAIRPDSPLEFRGIDLWEMFYDLQNLAGFDDGIQQVNFEFYSYYGVKVHKSRILPMKGLTAPSFIRPRLRGWGFSIVEALVRSINQYLKGTDLVFQVLDEFKIDVYKLKNLTTSLMTQEGTAKVRQRVQMANLEKNYQNAITMDKEDEYEQKELQFNGINETLQGIRLQIASDMRMPESKIFGIASTGFSSGEDDIENYNSMVESQVRQKVKHHIIKMIELRCQKLFGYVPDDISIDFKPLRVLSAEQEENVKTQKFNRLYQAITAGLLTEEEFRDGVNKDNLLGIQLDTEISALNLMTDQDEESEPGKEGESDDGGNTSDKANKPDSAKIAPIKSASTPKKSVTIAKEAKI